MKNKKSLCVNEAQGDFLYNKKRIKIRKKIKGFYLTVF
jgi:hypothetical protein